MYGLIKGCCLPHHRENWMAHLCGMCLALRKEHGWISGLAINTDGAILSMLCEAQSEVPYARVRHRCLLNRLGRGEAVDPESDASAFAAMISVLIGASKISDHIADRETIVSYLPSLFSRLGSKWEKSARLTAKRLGFATENILARIGLQAKIESRPGAPFLHYSGPVEAATGEACAFSATISDHPENRGPLYRIGTMFGRIIYLLDSYRDYTDDIGKGKFNALNGYSENELRPVSKEIFQDAHSGIMTGFNQLTLNSPETVRRLLVHRLAAIGRRSLSVEPGDPLPEVDPAEIMEKKRQNDCCGSCDCCQCGCGPCGQGGGGEAAGAAGEGCAGCGDACGACECGACGGCECGGCGGCDCGA